MSIPRLVGEPTAADRVAAAWGLKVAKKALIVGGKREFAFGELRGRLERVGIDVVDHWEDERKKSIPYQADLVLVLRDIAAVKSIQHARDMASRASVRVVEGTRKWPHLSAILLRDRIITPEMMATVSTEENIRMPDKADFVVKSVPGPETPESRVAELRELVARMFEQDGYTSFVIKAGDAGKPPRIEAERSVTRTEKRAL